MLFEENSKMKEFFDENQFEHNEDLIDEDQSQHDYVRTE